MKIVAAFLTIFSLYLCHQISLVDSLQVPDKLWEVKKCNTILDEYKHKNLVVDKNGLIDCWLSCVYFGKCELRLEQPKTYGLAVRFINFMVMSINFLIIYFFI